LMEGCDYPPPESLKAELLATVRKEVGPIATPDAIHADGSLDTRT